MLSADSFAVARIQKLCPAICCKKPFKTRFFLDRWQVSQNWDNLMIAFIYERPFRSRDDHERAEWFDIYLILRYQTQSLKVSFVCAILQDNWHVQKIQAISTSCRRALIWHPCHIPVPPEVLVIWPLKTQAKTLCTPCILFNNKIYSMIVA